MSVITGLLESFDVQALSTPALSWTTGDDGLHRLAVEPAPWLTDAGSITWNDTIVEYFRSADEWIGDEGQSGRILYTVEPPVSGFDPSIAVMPTPPRSEPVALVRMSPSTPPVRCGVAQSLAAVMPLGIRLPDEREQVVLEQRGPQYVVVDAPTAPWTRDLADTSAQALTLATPHHTVSVDPAPASAEGYTEGHSWVQVASAADETVLAIWRVESGAWVSQPVDEPLVAPVADIGVLRVALLVAEAIRAGLVEASAGDSSVLLDPALPGVAMSALDLVGKPVSGQLALLDAVLRLTSEGDAGAKASALLSSGNYAVGGLAEVLLRAERTGAQPSWLTLSTTDAAVLGYGDPESPRGKVGVDYAGPYFEALGGERIYFRALRKASDTGWLAVTSLNPAISVPAGYPTLAFRVRDDVLHGRGAWDVSSSYGAGAWTGIGFVPATITSKLVDEETPVPAQYLPGAPSLAQGVLRIIKSTRALEFRVTENSMGRVRIVRTLMS